MELSRENGYRIGFFAYSKEQRRVLLGITIPVLIESGLFYCNRFIATEGLHCGNTLLIHDCENDLNELYSVELINGEWILVSCSGSNKIRLYDRNGDKVVSNEYVPLFKVI